MHIGRIISFKDSYQNSIGFSALIPWKLFVSGTFSITVQSGKEKQRDAVDCQNGIGLVLQESHVLAVLLGVCVK